MSIRVAATIFLVVLGFASPASVTADGPVNGDILVPGDHFLPGEQFRITGFGIDPGIDLTLRLVSGNRTAGIGDVTVARDGTVEAQGVVPADFPLGYAELQAVSLADGTWSTALLIGPRAEGPGAVEQDDFPGQSVASAMLALGLLILVVVGVAYLRGGPGVSPSPD